MQYAGGAVLGGEPGAECLAATVREMRTSSCDVC